MIAADMTARISSPVFVGRALELATLEAALEKAEGRSAGIVLIAGEAGIGKSRLVAELAGQARDRGGVVLEGGCISLASDEGLPFGPIAEALRGLVRRTEPEALQDLLDPGMGELARLVPELTARSAGASLASPPEWAQTRLFEGFLSLLARLGERQPVLLVLEDLHWADRSTRDLLAFVARHVRQERVLIVGTYRSDELHRRHPLRPWLAEMERLATVDRLGLSRFGRDELAAQLAAIEGEPVSAGLLELIERRSEGNPFFAEELLASRSIGSSNEVPEKLRDVLLGRLATLSEEAHRVVSVAAAAGGTVDHELLAAATDLSSIALAEALGEAVSLQLLVPMRDSAVPTYGFRHALLGEAVYADLLAAERRRIHSKYATALANRPPLEGAAGASQLAALAYHATAAHDLGRALPAWIGAARASYRASAFAEAARAFERSTELWDAVALDARPAAEDLAELQYEASGALLMVNETRRASDLARAAFHQVDPADVRRKARFGERLGWAVYLAGNLEAGTRILDNAAEALADDGPSEELSAVLSGLATFIVYGGEYRRAIPVAERAVRTSRLVGSAGREIEAMGALGSSLAILGDCEQGLAVLRQALAKAKDLNQGSPVGAAFLSLTSTLLDCDALDEAIQVGLEGADWARGIKVPGFQAIAGEAMLNVGRWAEATALFEEAIERGGEGTGWLWDGVFAAILAIRTGRLHDAQALLEVESDGQNMLSDVAFAGNLGAALLELALAEGRFEEGRAKADEVLGWLAGKDEVRFQSRSLQFAIRIESELAAVARARRDRASEERAQARGVAKLELLHVRMDELSDDVSPVFGEARRNTALADAEATRLLDRPDRAAWARAALLFDAPPRPYELAWCRYREAEAILASKGARAEAARAAADAWSIASELGARPLRESIEVLARLARLELARRSRLGEPQPGTEDGAPLASVTARDPFGLTAREREVLALVAEGYTNRRIADALFITESTAGVHVANSRGKLRVTNRVEAAAVALRLGLSAGGPSPVAT